MVAFKTFPVLEVIGAIGGLVFFIFLVVAICSKSKKNWDEEIKKMEQPSRSSSSNGRHN